MTTQLTAQDEDELRELSIEDAQAALDARPPEIVQYIALLTLLLNNETQTDAYILQVRRNAGISAEQFAADLRACESRLETRILITESAASIAGAQREIEDQINCLNRAEREELSAIKARYHAERQQLNNALRIQRSGHTDKAGIRSAQDRLISGCKNPLVLEDERAMKAEARRRLAQIEILKKDAADAPQMPPESDPLRVRRRELQEAIAVTSKDPRVKQWTQERDALTAQINAWQSWESQRWADAQAEYDTWRLSETRRINQLKSESII